MNSLCRFTTLLIATLIWNTAGATEPKSEQLTAAQLVAALQLEQHVEGGYFKRTFQADHRPKIETDHGPRFTLTSIYYLLTSQSPIGHWHLNKSDIIHFFHLGEPINYYLITTDGKLETITLGPNPLLGHQLQMTVKGGTWKASHLTGASYGLVSEAVAPGFEYTDMTLGDRDKLLAKFPMHYKVINRFTRHKTPEKPLN